MIMCPSISVTPKKAGEGLYEVESTQPMIEGLLRRGKNYIETTIITPELCREIATLDEARGI